MPVPSRMMIWIPDQYSKYQWNTEQKLSGIQTTIRITDHLMIRNIFMVSIREFVIALNLLHLWKFKKNTVLTQLPNIWIQWGYEIQLSKSGNIWNPNFFKDQVSNSMVFKGAGFSISYSYVPTIQNPGYLCPYLKWFLTKWWSLFSS